MKSALHAVLLELRGLSISHTSILLINVCFMCEKARKIAQLANVFSLFILLRLVPSLSVLDVYYLVQPH